jgi:hypothetical protein
MQRTRCKEGVGDVLAGGFENWVEKFYTRS